MMKSECVTVGVDGDVYVWLLKDNLSHLGLSLQSAGFFVQFKGHNYYVEPHPQGSPVQVVFDLIDNESRSSQFEQALQQGDFASISEVDCFGPADQDWLNLVAPPVVQAITAAASVTQIEVLEF